ncbi:L,D-transpeptidase family protein [Massilia forsythiae]|uniref:L,D-transpeptidase family protein n=1 Tax=Massilia forsythiae TaxID=2728020 RepID=A0A7Z2W0C3_9BURK|nr:L,D-transpeptidase family protein [Massilia forsythiae]QJE02798.1 L,D-transpeptidase family protein [Massilia forsythiae]
MKLSHHIGAALAFCAAAAFAPVSSRAQAVPAAIRTLAAQASGAPAAPAGPYDEHGWLERFYAPRKYAPAWNGASAEAALWVLRRAALQGLDPLDYGAAALERQLRAGAAGGAGFDAALTLSMLRYLADLRVGRVRSEYHARPQDARLKGYDPVERLRAGLAAGRLQAAVQAAEPRLPQYGQVKAALAGYRALAGQPWAALPKPSARLAPGAAYAGAAALAQRLAALGDLPAAAPSAPEGTYGARLAQGVRRFQARHGLEPDGMLGRATVDALNVPPARRARQLALTLERLRWLPDFGAGPLVMVDLPAYRLWAQPQGGAAGNMPAALDMRVVIGSALKTETPLFVGQMRYLEFNPYWNVPRSILEKDILPRLARNPDYLAQNGMETVPAGAGMADLKAGRARVRQRPGPKNALGAVKFAMPNPMDIYLHSTPAPELFRRSRRDLSHGCIRVEDPAALAQYVLARQGQWDAAAVGRALQPGPTRHVDLAAPVPVVIFYATAGVGADGKPRFAADIYGRDAALEKQLAARHAAIAAATAATAAPGPA